MNEVASPRAARPSKRKRPFGVNAIIVLSVLTTLYSGLILALLYYEPKLRIPNLLDIQLARWLEAYLGATIAVQVLIIIGLWQMKRWGWFLVMLHTGLGMFLNIWAYFNARPNYVAMALSVLIVFYMNQRDVQQAFVDPDAAREPPAPPAMPDAPPRDVQESPAS